MQAGEPQADGRLSPGSPASDQPQIPPWKLSCLPKGKAPRSQPGKVGETGAAICRLTSYWSSQVRCQWKRRRGRSPARSRPQETWEKGWAPPGHPLFPPGQPLRCQGKLLALAGAHPSNRAGSPGAPQDPDGQKQIRPAEPAPSQRLQPHSTPLARPRWTYIRAPRCF